jgi:hypothetical protein
MKIIKIILFFLICSKFNSFSQGWTDWKLLYKEKGLTIEISFNNRGCNVGKPVFIKYRLYGAIYDFSQYLIYRIDYVDCNGDNRFIDQVFNISNENPIFNGTLVQNGEPKNDADGVEPFYASEISDKFYNIKSDNNKPFLNQGIKTNNKSTKPTRIKTDGDFYCGESVKLEVEGGSLSAGSEWVWYENSSGIYPIGRGSYIYVSPKNDTKYYVRAEGKDVTDFAEIDAEIKIKKPQSIYGKNYISFGEKVELSVSNPYLCSGYNWQWYKNSIYSSPIGYGPEITVRPLENTTYYVKSVGFGKVSDYVEKRILIYNNSSNFSNYSFNDNKLVLTYGIQNCFNSESYDIKIKAFNKDFKKIKINSLKGDYKSTKKCSSNKVVWNYKKDGYQSNDELFLQLICKQKEQFQGQYILKSLVWPGWGHYNLITDERKFRWAGLISYALIGNSLIFNKLSSISKADYMKSVNEAQFTSLHNKSNLYTKISLASAVSAAAIISLDIAKIIRYIDEKNRSYSRSKFDLKEFEINTGLIRLP